MPDIGKGVLRCEHLHGAVEEQGIGMTAGDRACRVHIGNALLIPSPAN